MLINRFNVTPIKILVRGGAVLFCENPSKLTINHMWDKGLHIIRPILRVYSIGEGGRVEESKLLQGETN